MWEATSSQFDALAKACGNRYLAMRYISTLARKLNDRLDGSVVNSKLISWALLDTPIEAIPRWEWDSSSTEVDNIYDFLCYVEDDELIEAVVTSYKKSVKAHHLVYSEENNLSQAKQARYRVLLRMVWYGL